MYYVIDTALGQGQIPGKKDVVIFLESQGHGQWAWPKI